MKKRVGNKIYNSETAEKLAEYLSPIEASDLYTFKEILFRKTTGEFFLYKKGKIKDIRYVTEGAGKIGSFESISPLTYSQAQKWAIDRLDTDEIDLIFEAPEDGDEVVHKTLNISKAASEKLKKMAAIKNVGMSEALDNLIKDEHF